MDPEFLSTLAFYMFFRMENLEFFAFGICSKIYFTKLL